MAEDLVTYLYVDSVLRTGIVSDNLTSAKSNSELVRSLESLLESSLACPKHPSARLPSTSCNSSSQIFDAVPSLTQLSKADAECEAVPSWSYTPPAKDSQGPAFLTVPAQEAIRPEPAVAFAETRSSLDVTAKFFYLPPNDPSPPSSPSTSSSTSSPSNGSSVYDSLDPAWIAESLEQLSIATGLTEVDTFIISFPGLTFDESATEDCCDDQNARTNGAAQAQIVPDEDSVRKTVLKVWQTASSNTHLLSLGVSEFSQARLKWLLDEAKSAASGSDDAKAGTSGIMSTRFRKPRVCQLNTRNRCDVPAQFVKFAKEEDVDLLVHSDCSDFLPPRTFTRLLARHGARLPLPLITRRSLDLSALKAGSRSVSSLQQQREAESHPSIHVRINGKGPDTNGDAIASNGSHASGARGGQQEEQEARETLKALSARWVLKYTVLIRDRALVADKGYIVKASRNGV